MKIPVFRGFLFGCFAVLAGFLSVSISTPANAVEIGIVSLDHSLDFVPLVGEQADVAMNDEMTAPTRTVADIGPIPPIYYLSWRTAGHSLTDYHLRC